MSHSNKVTVVLGAQWGDEGKGKLVDLLTENMQLVARFVMHWLTVSVLSHENLLLRRKVDR